MAAEARILGLQCLRCRARFDEPRLFTGCPRCRAEGVAVNLTVEYDLAPLAGVTRDTFAPRRQGSLALPSSPAGALGEARLARRGRHAARPPRASRPRGSGLPKLYAKDESQNPTWSYKDRLCAVAVTHAVATGARVITISSTGNHGASTAAYAARAGLPCVIFTLASVPETMKTLMQAYGAAVVACPTSESRWDLMRQGIERFGWYPDQRLRRARRSAPIPGASRATRRSPTRSPRISAGPRPTWSSCRARTATGSTASGRAGRSCRRSAWSSTRRA